MAWWDVLRDPLWQFVGALITAVSLWVAWRLRPRRRLSWTVISEEPVAQLEKQYADIDKRVRVLFDNEEVEEDVWLGLVRITCSGNKEIEKELFDGPLVIRVRGEDSAAGKILLAERAAAAPDYMKVEIQVKDGVATIAPIMLNKGNSFTVRCLETGTRKTELVLEARARGVQLIQEDAPIASAESLQATGLLLAFVMAGGYMFGAVATADMDPLVLPLVLGMGAGLLLWFLGLRQEKRLRMMYRELSGHKGAPKP